MSQKELMKDYFYLDNKDTAIERYLDKMFIEMLETIKAEIAPAVNCSEKDFEVTYLADIGNIVINYLDNAFYAGVDSACMFVGKDQPFDTFKKVS